MAVKIPAYVTAQSSNATLATLITAVNTALAVIAADGNAQLISPPQYLYNPDATLYVAFWTYTTLVTPA